MKTNFQKIASNADTLADFVVKNILIPIKCNFCIIHEGCRGALGAKTEICKMNIEKWLEKEAK